MTTSPPWPADRFANALALVEEGLTYTQVGARLGVSKGAIAGIMFRRGFCRRPAAKPPLPNLEERLGWERVTQTGCSWVEGEPGKDWQWCGEQRHPGSDYCAAHHAMIWTRATPPSGDVSRIALGREPLFFPDSGKVVPTILPEGVIPEHSQGQR